MRRTKIIYVTGISGSGKTTACEELKRRGFEAYDTDNDGVAFFYDNETGKATTHPVGPEERTPQWRKRHTWKARLETVEKLRLQATSDVIFLCGATANDADELWGMFARVFALTVDEATLKHRITTRDHNNFGKNAHEFNMVIEWQKTAAQDYKKLGAQLIDATQPIESVVDDILARSSDLLA